MSSTVIAPPVPLLVFWLLAATPGQCDPLWPKVFAALEKEGESFDKSELAKQVPHAKEKLRLAWLKICSGFSKEMVACANGAELDAEIAEARRALKGQPKEEVETVIARLRADWTIFECKALSRSIDDAARQVAVDAGIERP